MSTESIILDEWEQRLARAISQHNLAITPNEFLSVLADLGESSSPTTHADRDFLVTHAGISLDDLSDEAVLAVDLALASNRAAAAREVRRDSLTTQDVAAMLKMSPRNVRRALGDGALYSVKTLPGGRHRFPSWQFRDGRPLPGLRAVIAALPDDYHPLEVEEFMTEPTEMLRDMSPAMWLSEGGAISDVVALADGRSWGGLT